MTKEGMMGELLLAIFAIGAMGFYWGRNQPWVRWALGLPPRVVTSSAPQFSPLPAIAPEPQSDAVDRPAELPVLVGSELSSGGSELVYVTKDELVRQLALVVIVDDDNRKLSQDIISRAAAMSKERAAALIRAARNEPEPPLVNPLRVRDQSGERLIPR